MSVIRILPVRLRTASEICIAGLVGFKFRFLLDAGLQVADAVTEAPAARDVDDAAPRFGDSRGRWAATWAWTIVVTS